MTQNQAEHDEAAAYLTKLAEEQDRRGDWEEKYGRYSGSYRNKAQVLRDSIRASQMSCETGIDHCVCCFKPMSEHTNGHRNLRR